MKATALKLIKGPLQWLSTSPKAAFARSALARALNLALEPRHGVLMFYEDPSRSTTMHRIKRIRKEKTVMNFSDSEGYQIYMSVRNTAKVKGDMAEVGVASGGSALIIREANSDKPLHLFDTFEGLPPLSLEDDPRLFHKGQYSATLDYVRSVLALHHSVYFYPGLFPATGKAVEGRMFSFVHLDVDLYQSTLDSLRFFYPQMNKGGVIMSHDYIGAKGVRKAFDEFFDDKPEPIVELSCGSQCLIVKT